MMGANREKHIRWVKYPVIIAGERSQRYGLFEVTFYDGAPAFAELPRVVGYSLALVPDHYPAIVMQFAHAAMCGTLVCPNPVNLDEVAWDGSLTFDHLPILS